MCGIFGCISENASAKVLDGLRKLEYRGYDSAGLAAILSNDYSKIEVRKTTGFVSDLALKLNDRFENSILSIGHTRWATHGAVTDFNAHPHNSEDGKISIVHNGIIENADILLEKVSRLGYSMKSETDTEVIVHLLDHEIKILEAGKKPLDAFINVISQLKGSWAIAVIIQGLDGILLSRQGAPMVIGKSDLDLFVSSDIQPLYGICTKIAYMDDGDNFLLTREGIIGADSTNIPNFKPLEGVYDEQDPGIFGHMMLKEIHDQPTSLSNALNGRISSDGINAKLSGFTLSAQEMKNLNNINLVACGTAYFASEIISTYLQELTGVASAAFIASEFPARSKCGPGSLTIGISQSGETKDTIDALQEAKRYGSQISSICNVIGSTLARLTGNGAYLHAGPEFAVASTKVFSNMVIVGLLLALGISDVSESERREITSSIRKIPTLISHQILEMNNSLLEAADLICETPSPIFIGRGGLSHYTAREGALKMMEVSYIPCIALPAGELKHGAIALISDGTPVIAIAPSESSLSKTESGIRECKSRGAKIILITDSEGPITDLADVLIKTPNPGRYLSPLTCAIPLQLLAYHVGVKRGVNVDRPRNLAKSVTVD